MAGIYTLPQANNTGLTSLAQVLLGGATEYANNRRTDEREARLRTQRLADVADERRYADTRESALHTRNRGEALTDEERVRQNRLTDTETQARLGMMHELVRLRYLAPGDLNNPEAVAAAFAAAQADGTAKRYEDALKSGDLSYADLGDPARVEAGLAQFSQRAAARTKFQSGLPQQATDRSNQLVGEREQLLQRASSLEQRLSEPEPLPTEGEIGRRALQLAMATVKPGKQPSAQDIAAMAPQAAQEIASQKAMAWNQQRQDALVQRSLINDRLRDVSAEINTLTNRFGVVGVGQPGAAPGPAPTAAATPPTPRLTPEQFAQQLRAQVAPKPTAATAPARAPVNLTFSDPVALGAFNVGSNIAGGVKSGVSNLVSGVKSFATPIFNGSVFSGFNDLGARISREEEDRILATSPNSPEAMEIRRRRQMPVTNRLQDVNESVPIATPTPIFDYWDAPTR